MRRKQILYSLISLVLLQGVSSCKHQSKGEQGGVFLYSFKKANPVTTDSAKRMISTFLNITDVHELTVNKDENVAYFVSDADVNTTFEQNLTNGNFEFSKITADYNRTVPQLPSRDEAVKIAERYMAGKGIAPEDSTQLRLVHSGGVREQAVINGQKAGPIVDKLITLTYGRVIDSLQVIGAGSKIIINIGNKGEVMAVTRRWREVNAGERKQLNTNELFTQEEAQEQAKKQIQSEFGDVQYDIKSAIKSYYDGNGDYLQPVWAFTAVVNTNEKDKKLEPVKYLCIIPMLKNTPEPLKLNALDPKAKEMIKSAQPRRDTTTHNAPPDKNSD